MTAQVQTELADFHAFVGRFVEAGRRDLSPEDVLAEWKTFVEDVAAFREGLADIEAGRTKPMDEFLREFEAEHGLEGKP